MKADNLNIMDSHAHLTSNEYPLDKKNVMQRAINSSIKHIMNVCTSIGELEEGLILQSEYPDIVKNIACTTPHDAHHETDEAFQYFEKKALEGILYGIGETGFDDFIDPDNQIPQQEICRKYIDLGIRANLPVVFHVRGDQAFKNLYVAAQEFSSFLGVIHCFTGNQKQMEEALSLGWYISISGIATFKKCSSLREVIKNIPLDRLLIETDAPWLAPDGFRGKDNEPAYIVKTAEVIANIYNIPLAELCERTCQNGREVFSI